MAVGAFGIHLMFDGYGCPLGTLSDRDHIFALLSQLPQELAMHPICDAVVVEVGPKNRKDPGGISGFVMIAESHISIHTFPKRGFVSADVYSCQTDLDTERLVRALAAFFRTESHDVTVQERGRRYPDGDIQ